MSKIIIKGKFTVEAEGDIFKEFQQPLEYLEINLTMPIPYRIDAMRSLKEKNNGS